MFLKGSIFSFIYLRSFTRAEKFKVKSLVGIKSIKLTEKLFLIYCFGTQSVVDKKAQTPGIYRAVMWTVKVVGLGLLALTSVELLGWLHRRFRARKILNEVLFFPTELACVEHILKPSKP